MIIQSNLCCLRVRQGIFHDSLNNVGDSFTVAFGMMENLVFPKSPIGHSYYSRQLHFYIFGVVRHLGVNQPQSKENLHLYVWCKNQNKKMAT